MPTDARGRYRDSDPALEALVRIRDRLRASRLGKEAPQRERSEYQNPGRTIRHAVSKLEAANAGAELQRIARMADTAALELDL